MSYIVTYHPVDSPSNYVHQSFFQSHFGYFLPKIHWNDVKGLRSLYIKPQIPFDIKNRWNFFPKPGCNNCTAGDLYKLLSDLLKWARP